MALKVATARKMKLRQGTTSLGQIATADNKRQAFINTDTRRFKIQTGDMGPPPPSLAGPLKTFHQVHVNIEFRVGCLA